MNYVDWFLLAVMFIGVLGIMGTVIRCQQLRGDVARQDQTIHRLADQATELGVNKVSLNYRLSIAAVTLQSIAAQNDDDPNFKVWAKKKAQDALGRIQ